MNATAELNPMPRYYFHFLWRDDAVFDKDGVELEDYTAAYHHACGLVQQVRSRFPAADEDWWIEVDDGTATPTTVLPAMVPGAKMPRLRA
jgi:hypothetical protein